MKILQFLKLPILLLLVGCILFFIAFYFKISHLKGEDELLMISLFTFIVSLILAILKIIPLKKES